MNCCTHASFWAIFRDTSAARTQVQKAPGVFFVEIILPIALWHPFLASRMLLGWQRIFPMIVGSSLLVIAQRRARKEVPPLLQMLLASRFDLLDV